MKQGAAKGEVKRRRRTGYYDYNLLAAVIILICFGLVMLYSASAYEASNKFGNDMYYFGRQAVISLASVGAALAISKIDYHILSKWALHLYVLALILMAMVRFSPLGVTAGGARRWLNLGIQFQPSEIAKIAVILFLPAVILKMGRQASRRKAVLVLLFLGLVQAVGAYELTDNLSTAVIIMAISVVIIFLSHPKTRPFLLALVIITAVVGGNTGLFISECGKHRGFSPEPDPDLVPSGGSSGNRRLAGAPGAVRHRLRRIFRQGSGKQRAEAYQYPGGPERYDLFHYM